MHPKFKPMKVPKASVSRVFLSCFLFLSSDNVSFQKKTPQFIDEQLEAVGAGSQVKTEATDDIGDPFATTEGFVWADEYSAMANGEDASGSEEAEEVSSFSPFL